MNPCDNRSEAPMKKESLVSEKKGSRMLLFAIVAYEFIAVDIGIGTVFMNGFKAFDTGGKPSDIGMI